MNNRRMAVMATAHCLLGCMVGEMVGVTIGTHSGFATPHTLLLATILAFISGYLFSLIPLVRGGMNGLHALKMVFVADTLSILTMTIADNILMASIPGAMDKDLGSAVYWVSRLSAIVIAFVVAYPVNYLLIKRGKGHAVTHNHSHHSH